MVDLNCNSPYRVNEIAEKKYQTWKIKCKKIVWLTLCSLPGIMILSIIVALIGIGIKVSNQRNQLKIKEFNEGPCPGDMVYIVEKSAFDNKVNCHPKATLAVTMPNYSEYMAVQCICVK